MDGEKWVGDEITDRILGGFAKAEKGDRAVSSELKVIQPEYEHTSENSVSDDRPVDASYADGSIPEMIKATDDSKESELIATLVPTHSERQPETVSGSGLLASGLLISLNVLLLVITLLLVRLEKKLDRIGQYASGKNSDDSDKGTDDQSEGESGGKGANSGVVDMRERSKSKDTKTQKSEEIQESTNDHKKKTQTDDKSSAQASDSNLNGATNESPQDLRRKRASYGNESMRRLKKRYLKVTADSGKMGNPVLSEVDEGEDAHYIMSESGFVEINPDMSWYKNENDKDGETESEAQNMAFWNQTIKLSALFDLVYENWKPAERLNVNDYVRITRMVKAAKVRQYGNEWIREEKGTLVIRMDPSE